MSKQKRLSKCKIFLCMMLTMAILFGSCWSAQITQAATDKKYYIKINKGTNVVTVYEADGTPYTAFTCSTGYATPTGTFHTMARYRWWELDGPCWGQYCTRITGSILFHSVWYYANKEPGTQSYRQYNKLGTTASHGCCRLTVAASKWIYDNCKIGTEVIIFNGKASDDPLGKPKTIQVDETHRMGWDPTDPDSKNPYKTKSTVPKIKISSKTLTYGTKFGNGNMKCLDSGNFDITSWVKKTGKVNMKKVGNYKVTYDVVDSFGRTASKTVVYKVVDKKPASLTGIKKELTKDAGTNIQLLSGIKAKDAAGVNLTDSIRVSIKEPGAEKYTRIEDKSYVLSKSGTYKIKYMIINPNNNLKTTKYTKVFVNDTGMPLLTSENNWVDIEKSDISNITWAELMDGITASLPKGEKLTDEVAIKIVDEDGNVTTLMEGETYTIPDLGSYKLTYSVSNSSKNAEGQYLTATHERQLIVSHADDTLQGEPENE
ncbi:MAG: DUF5011 domain-containing protein [bacterium]|nr:DUF5011 domain-containing protein [bacterium]